MIGSYNKIIGIINMQTLFASAKIRQKSHRREETHNNPSQLTKEIISERTLIVTNAYFSHGILCLMRIKTLGAL